MSAPRPAGAWFLTPSPRTRAEVRLICFPFAGGGTLTYRDWPALLGERVEVVAVQLPGRDRRRHEEPIDSIPRLVSSVVDALAPSIDGPFVLFGHSMGAILAFETARVLRARGARAPAGVIVSARRAPHLPDPGPIMHLLSDAEFKARLKDMNGTPPEVMASDELMDLVLPMIRADFKACETHVYADEPALDCPLLAMGGDSDPDVEVESVPAWRGYTRGLFESLILRGDHFVLQSRAQEFVGHVSRWIDLCAPRAERADEEF